MERPSERSWEHTIECKVKRAGSVQWSAIGSVLGSEQASRLLV